MSEMDRNQQARMKEESRRASLQHKQAFDRFTGDLQLGRTGLVDRFGNRCQAGDSVLWRVPQTHDLAWTIKDIVPVLDPTKPVGVMRVKMVCEVPAEFLAGVPSVSMIRVSVPAAPDAEAPPKTPDVAEPTPELSDPKPVDDVPAVTPAERVAEGEVPTDGSDR